MTQIKNCLHHMELVKPYSATCWSALWITQTAILEHSPNVIQVIQFYVTTYQTYAMTLNRIKHTHLHQSQVRNDTWYNVCRHQGVQVWLIRLGGLDKLYSSEINKIKRTAAGGEIRAWLRKRGSQLLLPRHKRVNLYKCLNGHCIHWQNFLSHCKTTVLRKH